MSTRCTHQDSWPRWVAVGLIALTLVLPGCGKSAPKRGSVTGTVSYLGQPIDAGIVIFQVGDDVGNAMITDGSFAGSNIPVGKAKVLVKTYPPAAEPGGAPKQAMQIPKTYDDPTTTPLEVEIKKGKNKPMDFILE
jgi:hypothetical protein